jgi:tRNA U34 5-methylaminomethyl-2-thiouridine-forming methyltransferase MnmC
MHKTPIACKDGSWTFHNHDIGEAYHTPLGAAMEAREKFAAAVELESRAQKKNITILDVCYGLGYNSAAALEIIHKENPDCSVHIIGLEIDKDIVIDAMQLPFPFTPKEPFETLTKNYDDKEHSFNYKDARVTIIVLIGDAKERIKEIKEQADVVFFDAFSPKKQPEMWTEQFFKDIYHVCKKNASLVTYSCARPVRDNMTQAGFIVSNGPVVGRRGPATIATKHS